MRFYSAILLIVLLAILAPSAARATDTWQTLIPGVTYLHRTTTSPYHWSIHVVKADLTNPRVRIRVVKKQDSNQDDCGETTSSMARRYGALAAINTDFFLMTYPHSSSHQPQGWCVTDGAVTTTTTPTLPPAPLNSARHVVQFSAGNGLTALNVPGGIQSWWHNCTAGGPIILRNGAVSIELEGDLPNVNNRDPYTACALSQDGKTLIMLAEDGRVSGTYDGMTGTEIANVLIEMGGYQGMMFDGGGSTTMAINGSVANHPSDGAERKVGAALCVIDEQAMPSPAVTPYQTAFESPTFGLGDINGVDGWSRDGGGTAQVVSSPNHSGSQAMQVTGAGASHSISSIGSQSVTWIDCWMRPTSATGTATLYANSAGGPCTEISFQPDGTIDYLNLDWASNTTYWIYRLLAPSTYTVNTWYRITLREDFHPPSCPQNSSSYGVYSLYINGALQKLWDGPGQGFCNKGVITGINQVRFEHSGNGALLVDDLYVSNVEPRHWRVGAGQARALADGSAAEIAGPIVTSSFADACYVENKNRSAAIKLITSPIPAAGSKVNAAGRIATVGGEKVIQCNYLKVMDTAMTIPKAVHAQMWDLWQMRPDNLPSGLGLPLAGMSVRMNGRITRVESDRFYIDDGGVEGGVPVLLGGVSSSNIGHPAIIVGFVAAYMEPTGWATAIRPTTTGVQIL